VTDVRNSMCLLLRHELRTMQQDMLSGTVKASGSGV